MSLASQLPKEWICTLFHAFKTDCEALGITSPEEYGTPPISLVRKNKAGEIIASLHLEDKDMAAREDLSPWLTSLFVLEEYRNSGIGTSLLREAMEKFDMFYVYTAIKHKKFALDMGFEHIEDRTYLGHDVTVLQWNKEKV